MIITISHATYKASLRPTTRLNFIPYFGKQHNSEAEVGNKSCSRYEACFICNMNYCDHDIYVVVSHMSVANAGE